MRTRLKHQIVSRRFQGLQVLALAAGLRGFPHCLGFHGQNATPDLEAALDGQVPGGVTDAGFEGIEDPVQQAARELAVFPIPGHEAGQDVAGDAGW